MLRVYPDLESLSQAAAGLFVRLVQFAHARDEVMRRITAEWIEESAGATP